MATELVSIYRVDQGPGFWVKDYQTGQFVEGTCSTIHEAIEKLSQVLRGRCSGCGQKLRKVEGEGPCSDCMATQQADKEAAETETPVAA